MRTVVSVSAAEAVRMIAILVLQRPESSGKAVGAIEVHHQDGALQGMNVVLFDSAEEAQSYSTQVGGSGATVKSGTAPVLQLVTPPAPPAPEPAVPVSDAP